MRYAALFPGQGCQYKKMCEDLWHHDAEFRTILQAASEILQYDLWNIISESKMSEFTKSEIAQPVVTTVTYALYKNLVKTCSTLPVVGFGHSLGEVSALICAESISFEDGITFVKKRGKLMGEILKQKLGFCGIIVDMPQKQVEQILDEVNQHSYAVITGYNSPKQFMIGGQYEAEKILDDLISEKEGQYIPYRMIPMKANAPYHSQLISEYRSALHGLLEKIHFSMPKFPIISTVSGKVIKDATEIPVLLEEQLVKPVLWNQVAEQVISMHIDKMIDIGPKNIMKYLMLEANPPVDVLAWDDENDKNLLKRKEMAGYGQIKNAVIS